MKQIDKKYSSTRFMAYLKNRMEGKERNRFERELQKSGFETEALDGFELIEPDQVQDDLIQLREKLNFGKKRIKTTYWAAAAIVLLLITSSLLIFVIQNNPPVPELAKSEPLQNENIRSESDSILTTQLENKLKTEKVAVSVPEIVQPNASKASGKRLSNENKRNEISDTDLITIHATESEKQKDHGNEAVAESVVTATPNQKIAAPDISPKIHNKTIGGNNSTWGTSAGNVEKGRFGGLVTMSDGLPLHGVQVQLKGTDFGTQTDSNGYFTLINQPVSNPLTFSFTGMKTKEIIPSTDSLNIVVLEPSDIALSETVISNYATKKTDKNKSAFLRQTEVPILSLSNYLNEITILPANYKDSKVTVKIGYIVAQDGTLNGFQNLNNSDSVLYNLTVTLITNWYKSLADKNEIIPGIKSEKVVYRKK